MVKLLHKKTTGAIIGVYYDVYNGTGRTYPEYIYENGMIGDLRELDIPCRPQDEYQVFYKGKLVGVQRLDLFVGGEVVVEIKVVLALTKLHKAQAISYLKVVGKQVGLLFNFGSPEPEFERLYFDSRPPQNDPEAAIHALSEFSSSYLTPELTYDVIGGLLEVHTALGPGFIHRIYANACYYEFQLRGLDVRPRKAYQVIYRNRSIGEIKFGHLQASGSVFVFPVAVQDVADINIDNLKDWMRVQNIPIGILANFYDTSLRPVVLRI
ncbi:MAG: GxxExxY protein [Chloroflexota bacterium]|nr:GxxExxY protein [Chloroflexota bacterium]